MTGGATDTIRKKTKNYRVCSILWETEGPYIDAAQVSEFPRFFVSIQGEEFHLQLAVCPIG
jgi:hypothetical protein